MFFHFYDYSFPANGHGLRDIYVNHVVHTFEPPTPSPPQRSRPTNQDFQYVVRKDMHYKYIKLCDYTLYFRVFCFIGWTK